MEHCKKLEIIRSGDLLGYKLAARRVPAANLRDADTAVMS